MWYKVSSKLLTNFQNAGKSKVAQQTTLLYSQYINDHKKCHPPRLPQGMTPLFNWGASIESSKWFFFNPNYCNEILLAVNPHVWMGSILYELFLTTKIDNQFLFSSWKMWLKKCPLTALAEVIHVQEETE